MKTKIPIYTYVVLAIVLALACVIALYFLMPQKQKVTNIEEKNNTTVEQTDPTKNLPKPYVDETDPTVTPLPTEKIELAPIPTLSKELQDAIIKTEKDMDTSDGKEIRISE